VHWGVELILACISWHPEMSLVLNEAIYRMVFIRTFTPTLIMYQKLGEQGKFVCKTINFSSNLRWNRRRALLNLIYLLCKTEYIK
jgi:hypothetical protein